MLQQSNFMGKKGVYQVIMLRSRSLTDADLGDNHNFGYSAAVKGSISHVQGVNLLDQDIVEGSYCSDATVIADYML
jgi:hypothetical protein